MEESTSNRQNTPEIGNIYDIKRLDGSLCKKYLLLLDKRLLNMK